MVAFSAPINISDYDTDKQSASFARPQNGIYHLEVLEAQESGPADELKVSFKMGITAPEIYAGQWVYMNIWYSGPKSSWDKAGQPQLARLVRACDRNGAQNTDELQFVRFTAELKNKPYQKKTDGILQFDENRQPVMRDSMNIETFFYPDAGPMPEPHIFDKQPANDNQPAAQRPANDNQPAQQQRAAVGGKAKPWSK